MLSDLIHFINSRVVALGIAIVFPIGYAVVLDQSDSGMQIFMLQDTEACSLL